MQNKKNANKLSTSILNYFAAFTETKFNFRTLINYRWTNNELTLDFRTGEPIDVQMYFDDKIDIHHIFPRDYCKKAGIEAKYYDSIINKTPLSARTNKIIGGKAPSVYLQSLVQQTGIKEDRIDEILASHVIDVDAIKSDDFQTFFSKRREVLLQRIENATRKKILRETDQEIVKTLKEEEDLWIEEEEDTL